MRFITALAVVLVVGHLGIVPSVSAQETIERTTNLSAGWVGYPGFLFLNVPYRVSVGEDGTIRGHPTFESAMGLPWNMLVGGRFAHSSRTVPGSPNEWEVFGRIKPMSQAAGQPFDLGITAAYNFAAESIDGEVSAAYWLGPVRLIGAARGMTSTFGTGDARLAVGGGAVVMPLPGRFPLALTGDVMRPIDAPAGHDLAWSLGLQLGLTHTTHTVSVFATNTPTSTLQGSTASDINWRLGFEITIPIPAGRFLGMFVPREEAMQAVVEDPAEVGPVVTMDARDYLFAPKRLVIEAGTTVEWINRDQDVHTVEADDGTWRSGGIQQGESWRARFDRPGRYPYFCGPHPFMRGVVIVR